MGRGAGFFQLFAHPIRLGDDELRILALDIGQYPLAHVIGRIDVGKEEVGRGRLAIGPEIILRLDAIDPDLVARGGFGLDAIDPHLRGRIERATLEGPFPGVVNHQQQHGQCRQPGGGTAHIPGAPEGDEDQHRQRPQQAGAEHLVDPLEGPLLGAPAKGELLGQQPTGSEHHQRDAEQPDGICLLFAAIQ